jgi:hypothetical protein
MTRSIILLAISILTVVGMVVILKRFFARLRQIEIERWGKEAIEKAEAIDDSLPSKLRRFLKRHKTSGRS